MSTLSSTSKSPEYNAAWPAIVAEASAWIAMMHGPDRTPAAEQGLRRWLNENPLHAQAFELATDTWNEARASVKRGAKVKLILPGEREVGERFSWRWRPALATAAAVLIGVVLGARLLLDTSAIATGIGERRILTLDDGTQVTLNTATKVVVDYSKQRRRVRLETGEALFDVAPETGRPFVVTVGDREVTAIGTAFLVRRDDDQVAVTLMNGKVAVDSLGLASHLQGKDQTEAHSTVLQPGQRITFRKTPVARDGRGSGVHAGRGEGNRAAKPREDEGRSGSATIDRPEIAKLTSWQQGKVHIENLALADAIAEMNRYSTVHLEVDGAQAAQLHLSGVFRTGDSRNFANAVAKTHGLEISEHGDHIVLSGVPSTTATAQ